MNNQNTRPVSQYLQVEGDRVVCDLPLQAPDFIKTGAPGEVSGTSLDISGDGVIGGQLTAQSIVADEMTVSQIHYETSTQTNFPYILVDSNPLTPALIPITIEKNGNTGPLIAAVDNGDVQFAFDKDGKLECPDVTTDSVSLNSDVSSIKSRLTALEGKTQNVDSDLTSAGTTVFQEDVRVNDGEEVSQTRIGLYPNGPDHVSNALIITDGKIQSNQLQANSGTVTTLSSTTATVGTANVTTLNVSGNLSAGDLTWNAGTKTLGIQTGTVSADFATFNSTITNTLQVNSGTSQIHALEVGDAGITNEGVITGTKLILNDTDTQIDGATGNGNFAGTVKAYNDVTAQNNSISLIGLSSSVGTLSTQVSDINSNVIANISAISTLQTKTQALSDNGSVLSVSHPISMGANKVTSSGTPSTGSDLTNKTYVDAGDSGLQTQITSQGSSITTLETKTQHISDNGSILSVSAPVDLGSNLASSSGVPSSGSNLTNKTYVDTGLSGKQNTITTGTTSQYFKGDLSLGTAGNLISKSTVNNKTYYVSLNGSDSNDGLSEVTPYLTLSQALTSAGNSGNLVLVTAGTYSGNYTCSNQNVDIVSVARGGIVYFSGTLTVSNSASSVRLRGISVENITHSGNGSLYLDTCNVNTLLSHTGAGYLEVVNSSVTAYSGTGTGQAVMTGSSKVLTATLNNASKIATFSSLIQMGPLTITSCLMCAMGNLALFAATDSSNAITMAAGSLVLDNVTLLGPSGGFARMNLSGGTYSLRKVFYDLANSSFSGATRSAAVLYTDSLRANALTMAGNLDANSNKIVNLTNPTSAQDACTKYYADNLPNVTGSFLKTDGSNSMSANLNVNSNKVVGLANGTVSTDAVNKSQLDTKLSLTGGTMTGLLSAGGNLNVGSFAVNAGTGNFVTSGSGQVGSTFQAASLTTGGDLSVGGNATISGDLSVMGTTTTVNSEVNEFNGYVAITQNPADGTTPALSVVQGGTSSGPIFQVEDADTNVKFSINQDCDLNVNAGNFTVDAGTGDVSNAGDLSVGQDLSVTGDVSVGQDLMIIGRLKNSTVTLKNVSSLPGSGMNIGDLVYLTTDDVVYTYNGIAWVPVGSFSPIVTSAVDGDSLFYRGGVWHNGFYTDTPTLTVSGQTITCSNLSSPYSYNGSSSMYIQIKAYSDSGLTNLVYTYAPNYTSNFWTYTYGTGNNLPGYSTTYYLIARSRSSAWANSWSDWSNTYTITTPPNDSILAQLTTSAAAYNSASTNAWVQITQTEWNNINANIVGALESGNVSQFTTGSHSAGGSFSCADSQVTFTGARYPIALKMNATGYTGTNILKYGIYTNQVVGGNSLSFAAPGGLTPGSTYYFTIKTPSTTIGDNSGSSNYSQLSFSSTTSSINSITTTVNYVNQANPTVGTALSSGSSELGLFTTTVCATKQWP